MKKLPIVITLSGGLGNQLFQISAGLFIEKYLSRSTVYSVINLKAQPKGLPGNYTRRLEIAELLVNNEVIDSRFPLRLDVPSRFLRRLKFPESVLIESEPNDSVLGRITDRTTAIYGYFQSADLVEKVWEELKKDLIASIKFKELVNPKKIERICIHLRFGDYSDDSKTKATHGLTSKNYFEEAVNYMTSINPNLAQLVIVTDDVKQAMSFMGESLSHLSISYLSHKNPINDLQEIAKSTNIIMSNSTFSWWGAWFAFMSHEAQVVYPRPWFAGEADPDLPIYNQKWKFLKRDFLK